MIVDDESPARRRVRDLLAREPDIAIAAECTNGREAIDAISLHRPDLLFLDIQMPGVNGFEVLRGLPSKGLPAVIFTTAYDEYMVQAFKDIGRQLYVNPERRAEFVRLVRETGVVSNFESQIYRRDGDTPCCCLEPIRRECRGRSCCGRRSSTRRVAILASGSFFAASNGSPLPCSFIGARFLLGRDDRAGAQRLLSRNA